MGVQFDPLQELYSEDSLQGQDKLSKWETWPMCSDTSPPRLLTLPSRMPSRPSSPPPREPVQPPSSQPTLLAVELPVPCPFSSSTLLTTPEPGWLTMPRAREVSASSMVSLTSM